MDGYSVHDAAAVLGIPETRVWELIARGVLSGTPEADGGMRVFLKQATPKPAEDAATRNGNGGAHDVELSPFRELLTEFRNLTERYGQALLALGESRGEVAALRGRVDLLEARIDLRLPGMRPVSTVAWEVPEQEGRAAAEPAGEANGPDEGADAVTEAVDAAPPLTVEPPTASDAKRTTPRRRRGARTTPAAFAEALARAQDPTLPELPGAREAAAALAALQDLPVAEGLAAVAAEPPLGEVLEPVVAAATQIDTHPGDGAPVEETVAPAETAVEAAGLPSIYSTELVEPDWFADGDFSWLEQAAAAGAVADVEPAEPAPEPVAAEVEEVAAALAEPASADEPAEPTDESGEPTTEPASADEPASAVAGSEELAADFDAIDVPIEPATEPADVTTPAPEPEWLWVADTEPSAEWASLPPDSSPGLPDEATGEGTGHEAEPEIEPGASAANLGSDEVALMWLGDEFSAAELEFAAPGWGGAAPDAPAPSKPMEWVARDEEPESHEVALDPGAAREEAPLSNTPTPPAPAGASSAPTSGPTTPMPRPAAPGDADWLRGRRGPAATAYRRLRRLFPG